MDRLLDSDIHTNKLDKLFIKEVTSCIGKEYISNLAIVKFLLILSHQHVEDDKNCVLTSVIVSIGNKMILKFVKRKTYWGDRWSKYIFFWMKW